MSAPTQHRSGCLRSHNLSKTVDDPIRCLYKTILTRFKMQILDLQPQENVKAAVLTRCRHTAEMFTLVKSSPFAVDLEDWESSDILPCTLGEPPSEWWGSLNWRLLICLQELHFIQLRMTGFCLKLLQLLFRDTDPISRWEKPIWRPRPAWQLWSYVLCSAFSSSSPLNHWMPMIVLPCCWAMSLTNVNASCRDIVAMETHALEMNSAENREIIKGGSVDN